MRKIFLIILLVLCLWSITGCVSIPREELSWAIETEELSGHVHFLAQPALKGRKPRTWESATARQYLKNRFEAYGLVPWIGYKGYEQPFGFGTNVIGVLPGSEPNVADEIVILAAHYDHLGKGKKGIYHGACDNASGLSVLLEIAEKLALSEKRPKRSICFASFDCEERCALGAFAFTCQKDFEKRKIAAVINIDLLGRDFLDVVDGSLFVVGTQAYPELRVHILQAGKETDVKILPLGTDLVGPRGDHAAFETMDIPVLFFTCGLYKDYHKPTDTAKKLNYPKMTSSAQVIFRTLDVLANAEDIDRPVPLKNGDKDELLTLKFILEKINSNHDELKINDEQGEKLQQLAQETQKLLNEGKYSLNERRGFAGKVIEALLPAVAWGDFTSQKSSEGLLWMFELYIGHSKLLIEGYRDMVRQMLESKPGLFGKVNFEYKAYDLPDNEISFVEKQDGRYELDVILTQVHLKGGIKGLLFKSGHFSFEAWHYSEHFLGTKNQVTDYCLLRWRKNQKDESYGRAWEQMLKKATQQEPGATYNDWMQWWPQKQGWADEKQWLSNLSKSDNPQLAAAVTFGEWTTRTLTENQVYILVKDPNVSAIRRKALIRSLDKRRGQKALLTLVDVLTDETPAAPKQPRFMEDSYPFADHRVAKTGRKWWKEQLEKEFAGTIGQEAENKLKQLTEQDFGKDVEAWRRWIQRHVK
ncbi:MAG TPA: M28 family peptidase [Sedimentisphaerales bacterium]|nr:M28 family peptidase [Sedimentisphaerales bacterium]